MVEVCSEPTTATEEAFEEILWGTESTSESWVFERTPPTEEPDEVEGWTRKSFRAAVPVPVALVTIIVLVPDLGMEVA